MTEGATCRAIKRDGVRCGNPPQIAGFCRVHYPRSDAKPTQSTKGGFRQGVKTVGELIAVAGGAIKLIETVVHLWQAMPFGPGPRMPADYEYLADEIGFGWMSLDSYSAFNKGPSTVDWARARAIYDSARATVDGAVSEALPAGTVVCASEDLESSITLLLDSMQAPFREMLLQRLGSDADDA